ncbi:MAG: flippase-like domain-containing protein [Proteobacteria bacterium]|jgi:uncharacterized membrane protein YbhN (UPF0104 family)|nr:flippase-like domain-containing protein [Pseudomonadota bacterium]MBK8961223.1 flippase-like domain-containing protein [Pseudomonadota bacterium]
MNSGVRWSGRLLSVTLVAALAAWMLRDLDVQDAIARLHRGQLYAIALVQPLVVVAYFILGWRFAHLAAPPAVRLLVATRAVALSAGLNYLLPARTSEFVKALYLRRSGEHGTGGLMAAVVVERLMDLCIVATLTTLVVAARMAASAWVAIGAALGAACCLWLSPHVARLALRASAGWRWVRARALLGDFAERIHALSRVHLDARIWAMGAAAWAMSWGAVHVAMCMTLEHDVSWSASGLVFVASTLGFGIPVLPGGVGTVEVAAVAAQRLLGIELESAVVVAAVMRLQQVIVPLMWSAAILLREGDVWRRVKQPDEMRLSD